MSRRVQFRHSIYVKLLVIILVLPLLLTACGFLYFWGSVDKHLATESRLELLRLKRSAKTLLDLKRKAFLEKALRLASDDRVIVSYQSGVSSQLKAYLAFSLPEKRFASIALTRLDGTVAAHVGNGPRNFVIDYRSEVEKTRSRGPRVLIVKTLQERLVMIALAPVISGNGILGVLILAEQLTLDGQFTNTILLSDGRVQSQGPGAKFLVPLVEDFHRRLTPETDFTRIRSVLAAKIPIDGIDSKSGSIVVGVDPSKWNAQQRLIRSHAVGATVVFLLFLGAYGFVTTKAITKPVFQLIDMTGGAIEGREKIEWPRERNDEVGILISSYREVIEKLLAEEARFRDLAELLPQFVCEFNEKGILTFLNQSGLKATGYTGGNLAQGLSILNLLVPEDREKAVADMQRLVSGETLVEREYTLLKSDGATSLLLVCACPIVCEGTVVGVRAVAANITDLKRAKEEQKRLKEQSDGRVSERTRELLEKNHRLAEEINSLRKLRSRIVEQNEFFTSVLESITHPFYVIDANSYRVLMANSAAGLDLSSGNATCHALIHARSTPCIGSQDLCPLQEVKRTGTPETVVHTHFDADGRVRDVEISAYPLFDAQGRVAGISACAVDVTGRNKGEQSLGERDEPYRGFATEVSSAGIIVHDDGTILDVSETFAEMYGYEPGELIGMSVLDTVVPESEQIVVQNFCGRSDAPYDEVEALRKDGSTFPIAINIRPITFRGKRARAAVVRDLTEQKNAEKALQESRQRYSDLFEQSPDAILIVRPEGKIIDCNKACCELFGASREQIVGQNVKRFYWDRPDQAAFHHRAYRNGSIRELRWKVRRKDGAQRLCLLNSSLWRDPEGGVQGYLGIARDVTKEITLQTQLVEAQRMESVARLAAGIAHDFNNLLSIASGYSELLLAGKDQDDPDYEELQAIFHASQRGAELVQRILTFSRKMEAKPRLINLNDEVKNAQKFLNRTIPRLIDIDLWLAEDLPMINGDPGQIEQVLLNLAINAKDAMPDGGTLTIQTERGEFDEEYSMTNFGDKPGEYVILQVSDTGIGIDKNSLDRIFEPFYSTKEPGEGTGLGLAMVFGIVKGHHGSIKCYSEPGVGTTFKIYLPAATEKEKPLQAASVDNPERGTETILLVDDEEKIEELGKRLLTRAGYQVITARDGKEALAIYEKEKERISLVILDLNMPRMDGKQCLEELLTRDPKVKVVIISGYSNSPAIDESLALGAKGFLSKPFLANKMLQTVRNAIDEK